MVEGIEGFFPRLRDGHYRVTSARDDVYNCIAWAAGATGEWWWPVGPGKTYWPEGVPRAVTLEASVDNTRHPQDILSVGTPSTTGTRT